MSTTVPVANVCCFVDPDDSDFEVSASSSNKWLPGNGDSDEDEEEFCKKKSKKRRKVKQQRPSDANDDSDEDIPLARLSRRAIPAEDDLPFGDQADPDDVPLAELFNTQTVAETPEAEELEEPAAMFEQSLWGKIYRSPNQSPLLSKENWKHHHQRRMSKRPIGTLKYLLLIRC